MQNKRETLASGNLRTATLTRHVLRLNPGSNHDCWSFGILSSSINLLDFN